jgi:hypothetical protein
MVHLMNKQTKIIEHQKALELAPRIPQISKKSREIIEQSFSNRVPIYERKPFSSSPSPNLIK